MHDQHRDIFSLLLLKYWPRWEHDEFPFYFHSTSTFLCSSNQRYRQQRPQMKEVPHPNCLLALYIIRITMTHDSHSQGNIIFQEFSRTQLPVSRTNYIKFKDKGNKSRYVWKGIYLLNIWIFIDNFYGTASSSLLVFWSNHFYLNFN